LGSKYPVNKSEGKARKPAGRLNNRRVMMSSNTVINITLRDNFLAAAAQQEIIEKAEQRCLSTESKLCPITEIRAAIKSKQKWRFHGKLSIPYYQNDPRREGSALHWRQRMDDNASRAVGDPGVDRI
jgi:hypothetical protein